MQLVKTSIKRPTIVVVLFTILLALGAFSYTQLNYELIPKISSPIVSVVTVYPGASPYEVENSVTKEIEDAVSSMEGIKKITSNSMESVSVVTVELEQSMDVDLSLQEAQRKINAMISNLPDDVETPSLGKFDLGDLPIMRLGVAADVSPTVLYDMVDQKIVPELSRIPGVAQVNVLGGQEREIRVNINEEQLQAQQLSILQIRQAIEGANMDFPTGKIKQADQQTTIRLTGKYSSLEQMRNLVIVTRPDGSLVRLRDVAEVQDTKKDAEIYSRVNGENAIGLTIQKQSDANAVEISELAKAKMAELEQTFDSNGLAFNIASDSSDFTLEAAEGVMHDLVIAIVLVAFIMLLFLHSLRTAVIVMVSVPMSIIATLTGMYLFGFSLNLMSLLALSLVVGILVDDAIVVIENIYRHMEMGKNRIQAAYDGVREIGVTVVSITLVIIAVFVPIALTGGTVGDLLLQFSITVALSTALSLLVAFTVIPLLASRFAKVEHLNKKSLVGRVVNGFEGIVTGFENSMTGSLRWAFNHKAIVLIGSLLLFAGSFMLVGAGFIGSEFVASGDRGEFIIEVEMPKKSSLENTNFTAMEIERFLSRYDVVQSVTTTVGQTSGRMSSSTEPFKAEVMVTLIDKDKREVSTDIFSREVKIALEENIPGAKIKPVPVSIMGTADDAPIQVILEGSDLDQLLAYSQVVMDSLTGIEGTTEIQTSVDEGNPEIKVEVDREKMADLGLTMQMVGGTMQTAFSGSQETKYRDGVDEYDISIQLDQFDRENADDIRKLTLINNRGEAVQLGQFVTVIEGSGPSRLERLDRTTTVTVKAQVVGRPVGTVGTEVNEMVARLDMPEGVDYQMGGQLERQGEAFGSLFIALFASLALVYLIMVALYDSYAYPFVVMFSLPLAIIGALLALALTGSSLSIFSILGMIMLIGLVAKNAILVVDFTNQLKAAGLEVKQALIKATQVRIRPILMTTLAMAIGMLPIALASGAGAEWKNGLAWVLIGGLTSSMFLTLIVVPVIYYLMDRVLATFGWDKQTEIVLEETPMEELNTEIEESLAQAQKHQPRPEVHAV
ncbi:efflux RND transporter permease subunit [Roseivirga sp. BDSF3-8]|uniref:efflux RND transporter permease subunit n=1 Tax=Roseivirga sp. BDSF3-8 TaxID=3241598 RepID=UPI003531B1A0